MTLIQELEQGLFKHDNRVSYPHLFTDFYITDSGTKITVEFTFMRTIVEINNVETGRFHGWRVQRAIKKGARYVRP